MNIQRKNEKIFAGLIETGQLPPSAKMPLGIAKKYEYKGNDGGNSLLPNKSGHYWMNGYAMWRPDSKG